MFTSLLRSPISFAQCKVLSLLPPAPYPLRLTHSSFPLPLLSFPRPFLPSFWPHGMSNHMSDEIDTKLAVKAVPPSSPRVVCFSPISCGQRLCLGQERDMIKLQNGGGLGARANAPLRETEWAVKVSNCQSTAQRRRRLPRLKQLSSHFRSQTASYA